MKKYNIALVPKNHMDKFISLVGNKNILSNSYRIGDKSIPHVTICQFYCEQNNVDDIWRSISKSIDDTSIKLTFTRFSNITFNNKEYWVSLLPKEFSILNSVYEKVSSYVKSIRSDSYDPHLTLFNYFPEKYKDFDKDFNKNICILDDFDIILGESDNVGQLTKIVSYPVLDKELNYSF